MLFVAPWIMMLFQKDQFSMHIIHLVTPFTGLLYAIMAVKNLFTYQRQSRAGYMVVSLFYLVLTLLLAFTPLVPYSFKNGLLI